MSNPYISIIMGIYNCGSTLEEAINSIKNKYGKNSIVKAMNLTEGATTLKRNKLIGGHNAETEDAD